MPRRYPPDLLGEVLDLMNSGRTVAQVASVLDVTEQTILSWHNQALTDTGQKPGPNSIESALVVPSDRVESVHDTEIAGCRIRYAVTGDGPRTIVLVHGFGAHRRWWHLIEPLLADDFRVVALDLSGNGHSGCRDEYSAQLHALEIAGVTAAVEGGRALLVGHSLGGRQSVLAAGTNPELFAGLVVLDSAFFGAGEQPIDGRTERTSRSYDDFESIRARFRFEPPQPALSLAVTDPLVRYGTIREFDGWRWRADPKRPALAHTAVNAAWANVVCPAVYGYGTHSEIPVDAAIGLIRQLSPETEIVAFEGGHHHLPLERAQECAALIRKMAQRIW